MDQENPNPPLEQPSKRSTRCCFCLSRVLWILLCTIIILASLIILVIYIVITPRSFKFHVNQAKLTQFNFTDNNSTLNYNLVLNFTAQNPNKKLKIYYDVVEANAFYKGYNFSATDMNRPLRTLQDTKSVDYRMSAVFIGQHVMMLDRDEVDEFQEDYKIGIFRIDIKIYFSIRFRLGNFIFGDTKAQAKCGLKVPLSSNNNSGKMVDPFDPTKCEVDF